jgi:dihydroxyacetone kinase
MHKMKALDIKALFLNWKNLFNENVEYLTKLDGVAGDADLGIVMSDGFNAVYEVVKESNEEDVGKLFYKVGKAFNNAAPSSMGTLLSAGFMNVGKRLKGNTELCEEQTVDIILGMAEGVQRIGQAQEGEKTFLDAIFPAARAMEEQKGTIGEVMIASVLAAEVGIEAAKNMKAKHGRIAFKGEQSVGIVDPGTVVALFFVKGIAETWKIS